MSDYGATKTTPQCASFRWTTVGVVSLVIALLCWIDPACGQESPDAKLWLAQKLSVASGRWTYIGELNQRFYDDMSKWEELYGSVGFAYSFSQSWSASAFFRLRAERFNADDQQIERDRM